VRAAARDAQRVEEVAGLRGVAEEPAAAAAAGLALAVARARRAPRDAPPPRRGDGAPQRRAAEAARGVAVPEPRRGPGVRRRAPLADVDDDDRDVVDVVAPRAPPLRLVAEEPRGALGPLAGDELVGRARRELVPEAVGRDDDAAAARRAEAAPQLGRGDREGRVAVAERARHHEPAGPEPQGPRAAAAVPADVAARVPEPPLPAWTSMRA